MYVTGKWTSVKIDHWQPFSYTLYRVQFIKAVAIKIFVEHGSTVMQYVFGRDSRTRCRYIIV